MSIRRPNKSTLLLNADFNPISVLPLSVIDWRKAITLMVLERITPLHDHEDWVVKSQSAEFVVPAVAITKEYFDIKKGVRWSRKNLYIRDLYTCGYCDNVFDKTELTIDHVIPRARGGKTTWENTISCCKSCNSNKSDKLMVPLRKPFKPDYWYLLKNLKWGDIPIAHPSWNQYISIEDKGEAV